jgi:zinc D-Ala-D-Ala dipeptidase
LYLAGIPILSYHVALNPRMASPVNSIVRTRFGITRWVCAALLLSCAAIVAAQNANSLAPGPKPPDIPQVWKPWIGEYALPPSHGVPDTAVFLVSEKDGSIVIVQRQGKPEEGKYRDIDSFPTTVSPLGQTHRFLALGPAGQREMHLDDMVLAKITPDFDARAQILIAPVRPIAQLRAEALAASPPHEDGPLRKPDLVELAPLDPAIHLDIRYATSNDFLGTPVYTQARAFLQRPAAQALLRALHKLEPLGYGLLIHDAYRPWYVTKIFWDATPPEGKIFVADPSQGSRHNRGCAVDLTLYDLATGKPIEMPGTYDEMSPRSFPDYPGGTSLQRWHRDLLRRAMESEGFTVYEHEWWHFDYKDWREYPILNVKFEDLHSGQGLASAH